MMKTQTTCMEPWWEASVLPLPDGRCFTVQFLYNYVNTKVFRKGKLMPLMKSSCRCTMTEILNNYIMHCSYSEKCKCSQVHSYTVHTNLLFSYWLTNKRYVLRTSINNKWKKICKPFRGSNKNIWNLKMITDFLQPLDLLCYFDS